MSNPHKPRILIIEDNPGDILLFRFALSDAGLDCEISEISDGEIALELLRSGGQVLPDLVVLDLNLPKVSGREILAAIRAQPDLQPVPVVIWTSSNAHLDRMQLQEFGIARYLVKPPEFRDLAPLGATIKEILSTG